MRADCLAASIFCCWRRRSWAGSVISSSGGGCSLFVVSLLLSSVVVVVVLSSRTQVRLTCVFNRLEIPPRLINPILDVVMTNSGCLLPSFLSASLSAPLSSS